jgi:ATP-binding cassette subfamily B protein
LFFLVFFTKEKYMHASHASSIAKEYKVDMQHQWFSRTIRYILGGSTIHFSNESQNSLNVRAVLTIFAGSVKKFPVTAGSLLFLTILGSTIGIIVPTYYKEFFAVTARDLSVAQAGELLLAAVIAIAGLNVFGILCTWGYRFILIRLAKEVMIDLRLRAFDHLIAHSHEFYTKSFTGALVQKLSRLQRSYDRIADSIVFHIVPAIVTVVGVIFVLWGESRILAYALLCWVALLLTGSYYFARWKLRYDVLRAELDSRVTAVTADILTNQAAVEAHGSHEYERARHEKVVKENFLVAAFTWRLGAIFGMTQHSAIVFLEFLTFFIGISLWMKGEFPLSMFMLVYVYVFRLTEQLWPFSQVVRDVYESFAEAKEPAEFMLLPHDIAEQKEAIPLSCVKGEIDFHSVQFSYGGKVALTGVDLHIKKGERVALVGPSGAGKSSLTKLLLRQYDVTGGVVAIDGVDVRSMTLTSLRSAVSIVPQDPILFHRTLRENIRYGNPSASDADIIRVAKLAHCDEFISALPRGYDTLVGERGVKLSGGERQRVAIARAFLRDTPILVLDEATSSLDPLSESLVLSALNSLMSERTTLIIAHRLSTIRNMERIVVLDEGRIAEEGTHEELLANNGLYANLWSVQQKGFVLTGGASVMNISQ